MTSQHSVNLDPLTWTASNLHKAVILLAQKSGLLSNLRQVPKIPRYPGYQDDEVIGQWLEIAANRLEIEVEAVESPYAEVEQMIRTAGPALIRMPDSDPPRFLVVLKGGRRRISIITPHLTVQRLPLTVVRNALTHHLEEPFTIPIQQLLNEAGVPIDRQAHTQTAILREQLSEIRIGSCWLLRMSPGANFWQQIRLTRLPRYLLIILGTMLVGQILMVMGWWVIGRGVLQGHFDRVWLVAWALLLFTGIPFSILGTWMQNLLSLGLGGLFKQRLLYGILQLEPEEIRHQGAGQFLGIVMESEALEALALGLGFTAILSVFELVTAIGVLAISVRGWYTASVLVVWIIFTGVICWYYYRSAVDWITTYRGMTNDLVERMVGHRTRLAQEDRAYWHDEEDEILEGYQTLSERLDHIGIILQAIIGRGWLIVGFIGIASIFVEAPAATAAIAISLGGIILASQALAHLTSVVLSIIGIATAWKQVGPLFQAATRQKDRQISVSMLPTELDVLANKNERPVVSAHDLTFRYLKDRPSVIQKCRLQIYKGDHLLLEGPSGGGKSTLAALIAGLRMPESGELLLWGVSQATVGTDEWRRRVVTAPQFHENHVLTETFAFNLLMGRRWPPLLEDLEDAEEVCRELGLGDLLDRMPAGFQQMVGESGWRLSHGERSRLYIARALLQKADLIILDESFAALDPENLRLALQCVLRRAPTLLVIAHP